MSKLFNKLNSLERGFAVNEVTQWSPKSSSTEQEKIVPQQKRVNKYVIGFAIVACVIAGAVIYGMKVIKNIETSNASSVSQLNVRLEEVTGQVSVLALQLKGMNVAHDEAMLKKDQEWGDKFNHLQATWDNQVNKLKMELMHARMLSNQLKAKNQGLENQIQELHSKIETAKMAVVQ